MKLTVLLLLLGLMQLSASVLAQNSRMNLAMENQSLKTILKQIEQESNYRFFYSEDMMSLEQKVTIDLKNKKIEEILDALFANKGMTYQLMENNLIVLRPLNAPAFQGEISVQGIVTDENGIALPGVTVVIKGSTTGTITDPEGSYVIKAPADAILVYSFVGMRSQEQSVKNRTTINISLEPETIGLEEVVAVGYGVQKKATLTGSIGSIKAEDLVKRPVANSTELLQGQVAGLITRQTSGLPGADGTTLNIRGYGSPLILIDGIQGSLGQIDPNDIESISILKDAAAAIYGARAGNGVIIVTTRRGAEKASSINYHGSYSVASPTFLPDLVGAREWAELLNESGLNPDDYSPDHVTYNPETKTLTNVLDGSNYKGYDWADALYRKWTPQQQHNISASGGNQNIKYFVSVGFTDQESNFKSGDYDFNRYNIRSNIDASINKNLSIALDFAYRSTILDKANFDVTDMYNSLQTAKPVYPFEHEQDPTKATYSGFLQRSPYYQTFKEYSGFIENRSKSLQGAIELRYSVPFVKGLIAKARLSYEETFNWNKNVSKPFEVYQYDQVKASEGNDPWVRRGIQNTNKMFVYSDRGTELLPLVSIEYSKSIGAHNLSGVLVGETRTYKGASLRGDRKDILSYEAPYLRYASEEGKDNTEGTSQNARASIISRINYDYAGKYMLEFAMRADASAEYPPKGRWGYFPSFSAGWRISEESFIKNNFPSVDNLKLRASYGVLGNDAISSFAYLTGYNITTNYFIFGAKPAPVISSAGLANPDVTWETMTMYNIGLDGSFWDGLLGFEADVFYRLRENILTEATEQVPSTFGAQLPLTNLNKRDNRGFELTLTHRNKIGQISYELSPRISWTRGKYVDLQEEVSTDPEWNKRYVNEGQWDDRQWAYLFDGFFMNQDEITNHLVDQDQAGNQTIKVGDMKYKDLNGDNLLDWRDQAIIGTSGLPNWMYSLTAGAGYKNLQISALFQGGANYSVSFGGSAAAPFSNESIPLSQHYQYRAIIAKDADGKAYISNPDDFKLPPVTQNGRTANNSKGSDFWTYNAKFLRLKNINISYRMPKKIIDQIGMKDCTFYLSGTNLFTVSNLGIWKKSFDPEITGQDNRDYPPVKTITLGLRLTL